MKKIIVALGQLDSTHRVDEHKIAEKPLEPKSAGLQPQLDEPKSKPVSEERKVIKPEPKLLESSQETSLRQPQNEDIKPKPRDSPLKQQPARPKPVPVKLQQKSLKQPLETDASEVKPIQQIKATETQLKVKIPIKKFIPARDQSSIQKPEQPEDGLKPESKLPQSLPTLLLPQPIQPKQPSQTKPVQQEEREGKAIESPTAQSGSNPQQLVELLRSNLVGPNKDGSYSFDFETSDGMKRKEEGHLEDSVALVVKGSYSYTAPDGTFIEVIYVADKNGFQPEFRTTTPRYTAPDGTIIEVKYVADKNGYRLESPEAPTREFPEFSLTTTPEPPILHAPPRNI